MEDQKPTKTKFDKKTVLVFIALGIFISIIISAIVLAESDNKKRKFLDKSYGEWNSAHTEYEKRKYDLKMILKMYFGNDYDYHKVSGSNVLESIKKIYDSYVAALNNYNAVSSRINLQANEMNAYCNYCKVERQEVKITFDGTKATYEIDKGFLNGE
jgi:hypothetical protein